MPAKAPENSVSRRSALHPEFSKRGLEALFGRQGMRLVVKDPKNPGLRAELREGGGITFYVFKRQAGGGPERIKIGEFPLLTVDQARKAAMPYLSALSQGKSVATERRKARRETTVQGLIDSWLAHARQHKRTWEEDKRQFEKLLPINWPNRRLSAITRADVRGLHAKVGERNGPYAANRLLALLRAAFNLAAATGEYEGVNPTKGIRKFKEQTRDRFLQPSELPAFFKACDAEPNDTLRDFFKCCLYTGARRSNVQAMRWSELDLKGATWRIPDTKSGEPVTVPLPAPAVEILTARKLAADGESPWVFPGGKKNRSTHLSSPKDAWKRLIVRAGLKDLRIHDLRRTFGSFQAASGASLAIIGKSLGHKAGSSATAIYSRLNLDPVRASVDVAVQAIVTAAAAAKEGSNG